MMKPIMEHMEEVLSDCISGFHQYILRDPVRPIYVGRQLCEMLGVNAEELVSDTEDRYAARIHPADRGVYAEFLRELSESECTRTVQYRLTAKDGMLLHVSDTMTSRCTEDGTLVGHSVLSDITPLKTEMENLRFLNDTVPCGFLKYTCEKQPKVTYINDRMIEMLRFPETRPGELDYLELYRENIFLMIPMEERRMFSHFLHRVYTQDQPIAGEITVLRCDGTKAHMFGWVTKTVNAQGQEEFQSVCIDVTEKYRRKKADEAERYVQALTDVYDHIFEYDFSNNTVKVLYGQKHNLFSRLLNIPMQMEEATAQWIESAVHEDDRARVSGFFGDFCRRALPTVEKQPPQIRYRALSSSGECRTYVGIFVQIAANTYLFCCRHAADETENDTLRHENLSLKNINENMQELVLRFTDGIAAFEVTADNVTPLYASDNVCEFFGFTKEEWLPMMKQSNSIKDFVSRSSVAYEDFVALLETGEAEFTYYDLNRGVSRRIKAICSQKSPGGTSPRYVMLYNVHDGNDASPAGSLDKNAVSIRTFGYFDVFIGETPIAFRNKKSKELLALLVDRRGGYVSSEEAIGFLWEDEPANSVTLARYRKVALRLKNLLEEYGIADIVESVDGKRRIVPERIRCDLYEYLSGKEEFSQLFKGSYMTNYSWGENTLGELMSRDAL